MEEGEWKVGAFKVCAALSIGDLERWKSQLAALCRAVEGPHCPEQVGIKRAEEINCRDRGSFKVNKMTYIPHKVYLNWKFTATVTMNVLHGLKTQLDAFME